MVFPMLYTISYVFLFVGTSCKYNGIFYTFAFSTLLMLFLIFRISVYAITHFIAQQQACIQIAVTIYTQARLRTSLFCFLLYQLSLWWVKYRAQPEAINP